MNQLPRIFFSLWELVKSFLTLQNFTNCLKIEEETSTTQISFSAVDLKKEVINAQAMSSSKLKRQKEKNDAKHSVPSIVSLIRACASAIACVHMRAMHGAVLPFMPALAGF